MGQAAPHMGLLLRSIALGNKQCNALLSSALLLHLVNRSML